MKNIHFLLCSACFALLAATSCTSEQLPDIEAPATATTDDGGEIVITAIMPATDLDTKLNLTDSPDDKIIKVTWASGDKIMIVNASTKATHECAIKSGAGEKSAKFNTSGFKFSSGEQYYAVYPASAYKDGKIEITTSAGTSNDLNSFTMYMRADKATVSKSGNTYSLDFKFAPLTSLLKLNLTLTADFTGSGTVSDIIVTDIDASDPDTEATTGGEFSTTSGTLSNVVFTATGLQTEDKIDVTTGQSTTGNPNTSTSTESKDIQFPTTSTYNIGQSLYIQVLPCEITAASASATLGDDSYEATLFPKTTDTDTSTATSTTTGTSASRKIEAGKVYTASATLVKRVCDAAYIGKRMKRKPI